MNKQIKVIKVVDDVTVVINAGSADGISSFQKFTIYRLDSSDLIDPDTKENLGKLEIVKGVASPTHIQEKITTLQSAIWKNPEGTKTVVKKTPLFAFAPTTEEIIEQGNKTREPFDNPTVGDLVKLRN